MASSLEPIVVQIVKSAEGTSTATGGGSGVVGGVSKLTGIANMAQEGIAILSEGLNSILKPIRTLLVNAVKLIGQFLRPVADIIILLLQPILMLIKPLVKLFNLLMQPFRKIAYDLMKHAGQQPGGIMSTGGTTLLISAMSVMLQGLLATSAVMISKMVQMFFINPVVDLLKPLFDFFGVGEKLIEARDTINSEMDKAALGMYNNIKSNVERLTLDLHKEFNLIDISSATKSFAKALARQLESDMVNYGLPKKKKNNNNNNNGNDTSTIPTIYVPKGIFDYSNEIKDSMPALAKKFNEATDKRYNTQLM